MLPIGVQHHFSILISILLLFNFHRRYRAQVGPYERNYRPFFGDFDLKTKQFFYSDRLGQLLIFQPNFFLKADLHAIRINDIDLSL